jgi:hypothetical protein
MRKVWISFLMSVLVAACDGGASIGGSSTPSLVEGDIEIDVLLSNAYSTNNHDLTGSVLSLKDNPSLPIMTLDATVEPGFQLLKYLKIRNEGNYPIQYQASLTLNEPLDGEIFYLSLIELQPNNQRQPLFDTNNTIFSKDHQFITPSYILSTRSEFDIYELNLTINPSLDNEFNWDDGRHKLAFSLLVTGQEVTSDNAKIN